MTDWKSQITVEPIKDNTGDLFIVNAARVSHNKWKDTLDDKDQGLINFLARSNPPHKTPFRHPRHTFDIADVSLHHVNSLVYAMAANPFLAAGITIQEDMMSISVLGIIHTIKVIQKTKFATRLCLFLCENYPITAAAFNIIRPDIDIKPLKEMEGEGWHKNLSFRCTAPIWLTRQLAKHQVGMSINEVSRRYVSTPIELFNQEFRVRAENIKQGSGAVREFSPYVINEMYEGVDLEIEIEVIMEYMKTWYTQCVTPDRANLAPETVRGYMPLNMMTTWIWSGAKPTFEHMIHLREEAHAQVEARWFATKMREVI